MEIINASQSLPKDLINKKFSKKKEAYVLLSIAKKNLASLDINDLKKLFEEINQAGCSCATFANVLGKYLSENEDELKKFDFELKTDKDIIDCNRLLVDIFTKLYVVAKVKLIEYQKFSFNDLNEAAKVLLNKNFNNDSDIVLKLFEAGYKANGYDENNKMIFEKRIPVISKYVGTANEIAKEKFNITDIYDFAGLKKICENKNIKLEYKDLSIYEKLTGLTSNNFNYWANYYINLYNLSFNLEKEEISLSNFENYDNFKETLLNYILKGESITVGVGPNKDVHMHTDKLFSWTKISDERAGHIMNFLGFDKEGNIKVSTYGETYIIPKEYAKLLEFSKIKKKNKNIMFDNKIKSKGEYNMEKELIELSAAKVHEDWCYQELEAFFDRMQDVIKKGVTRPIEIFEKACYKGDTKRNEVEIDTSFMMGHETMAQQSLTDFNTFMNLFKIGAINVKRFAKRNLTEEEQERLKRSNDYKDGNENILRPFEKLSNDSRKENLNAAQGAYNVYVELSKAGITPDEMQNNPDINNIIGIAIHADWLKRNKEHPDDALKVPYSQLDEWTQNQDITVFNALLKAVKENGYKFLINKEEGYELPDYEQMEKDVLGISL